MAEFVVDFNLTTALAEGAPYGRGLFFESLNSAVSSATDGGTDGGRVKRIREVRQYTSTAKATEAGESQEIIDALGVWFSASPYPHPALVGTQMITAQPSVIRSGAITVTSVEALGDSYSITLGSHTISADFDTLTTRAAIATALQTALNAASGITGATVSAEGDQLHIVIPAGIAIGSGFTVGGGDESALPIDAANATYMYSTVASETATTAINRIKADEESFQMVFLIGATAHSDIASGESAYQRFTRINTVGIEHREFITFFEMIPSRITVTADTGWIPQFEDLPERDAEALCPVATNEIGDNVHVAIGAICSPVDYTALNQHFNIANKTLPTGVPTADFTQAVLDIIEPLNITYYKRFRGLSYVVEGRTLGNWIDVVYLQQYTQTALWKAAMGALGGRGASQTQAGTQKVVDAMGGVLSDLGNGGFLQLGGTLLPEAKADYIEFTGDREFDGRLPVGWKIVHKPIEGQTAANRSARKAVAMRGYAISAGNINQGSIIIDFNL